MSRPIAVGLTAILILGSWHPAACRITQAAGPFPEQVIERPAGRSNTWAYAAMAGGAALIGASFVLAERGNDTYDEYLAAIDPPRIADLYDETERYDHLASASLIAGEALVATGLYLRFLRRPAPVRVSLGPARCAVAWRF